jgi:Na+/melibiose symporter-like transporter
METDGTQELAPEAEEQAAQQVSTVRQRLYLAGSLVDSLGSGLWMPFGLIFFTKAQGIPADAVGLALTIGGIVGLLCGPLAGTLVDHRGAGPVLLVSNLARIVTFSCYPFVGAAWQIALLAAMTSASDRMFWASNAPLLGQLAEGRRLDSLLGTQSVIRIAGLGVGAAVATPLAGNVTGLHVVSWLNAATFAAAACFVFPVARAVDAGRRAATAGRERVAQGWGVVLRDRPYLVLCAVQVVLALAANSLVVILPLVALSPLGGPLWLPGASVVVGNVVLALAQKPAVRYAERRTRQRGISLAGGVFALAFVIMLPGRALGTGLAVAVVMATSVVGVIGEALSAPLMTAAAHRAAPEGLAGRYSAAFQTAWGAAGALSPAVCTGLLALGYGVLWSVLAVLALLSVPLLAHAAKHLPAGSLRA